jgi:hypothetical protein
MFQNNIRQVQPETLPKNSNFSSCLQNIKLKNNTTISENLKWSTYINKICIKANSTLGFIRRNLKHCNRKFKEAAYISLVRSLFDYSSTVWDPHLQKDIDRIENVQCRSARFIYSDYKRTPSLTILKRRTSLCSFLLSFSGFQPSSFIIAVTLLVRL